MGSNPIPSAPLSAEARMRRIRRNEPRIVNVMSRQQLAYWTSRWGVTVEELRIAVFKVGPRVERVAEQLGKEP